MDRILALEKNYAYASRTSCCYYDNDEFWKGIKKLNQCNNIQANCIEGKTGEKDIAHHWKEYFCKLLNNNVINETLKDSVMGKLEGTQYTATMSVSTEEVSETNIFKKMYMLNFIKMGL